MLNSTHHSERGEGKPADGCLELQLAVNYSWVNGHRYKYHLFSEIHRKGTDLAASV